MTSLTERQRAAYVAIIEAAIKAWRERNTPVDKRRCAA